MNRCILWMTLLPVLFLVPSSCSREEQQPEEASRPLPPVELSRLARVFSELPLGVAQMKEVHDAVSSSSSNGYDEEYMMSDLLETPGKGVGDLPVRTACRSYDLPLRDLLKNYLSSRQTRSSSLSVQDYLDVLSDSHTQIYWPYSERWDGRTLPVITFDPEDGSDTNTGYLLEEDAGGPVVREVEVSEALAMNRPVWVMNRNDDSAYTSLEIHRQEDPGWGQGGGAILPSGTRLAGPAGTASRGYFDDEELRTLMLKDFTALRNYDNWFSGASEFFIKMGSIENFTASTEAELQLFNPSVTDFMVIVRRNEIGIKKPLNTILVSDLTPQLVNSAFMVIEDDGGKRTQWECNAVVKIKSKNFGFSISIPYNSKDDIVWRGSLTTRYFWHRESVTEKFGDVLLTFEILRVP